MVQSQQPQPLSQPAGVDHEAPFGLFRQPPAQPQPQVPQIPATQPAAAPVDFQQLLATLNAQKQLQQMAQVPHSQPSVTPGVAPALAAVMSHFANQQNQHTTAEHAQWQGSVYEDPERKRRREASGGGYDGASDDTYSKRAKSNGDSKAKKVREPRGGPASGCYDLIADNSLPLAKAGRRGSLQILDARELRKG